MLRRIFCAIACATAFSAAGLPLASAQADPPGFVTIKPDDIQWRTPLGIGVAITTLYGDPSKPGLFIQRVRFPPHVFDRPHFHQGDRYITVIQGTWYSGTGENWNPDQATPLKPGSFMFQPAKAVHWDGAKDEEVVIQVVGYGPGGSTLVDKRQPFLVQRQ